MKIGNKKFTKIASHIFLMLFFSLVRAWGTYAFIVPNAFAPGGMSGLSSVLYNVVAIYDLSLANSVFNPAITVFLFNIPILIASWFILNKKFVLNTIFCVIAFSLFMGLFSILDLATFSANNLDSSVMMLAAVVGGVLCGVSFAFLLKLNSCMGGSDTIGKIIYQKNPIIDVQWIIFACDCLIALLSGVIGILTIDKTDNHSDIMVKVLTPILYSFISLFVTSKVADVINIGLKTSLVVNIVTDKGHEIGKAIVDIMKRSGSIISVEGVYTHKERELVVCVIRKKQLEKFKKNVLTLDDKAFMYITDAKEVRGFGFAPLQDEN